jgi:hypothetical protein
MNTNEEMSQQFPGLCEIPNTISNQDDSDEEVKDEILNSNPRIRSFTDRHDATKRVFTNDLKQFIMQASYVTVNDYVLSPWQVPSEAPVCASQQP